jgi:hypothetical protein
MTRPNTTQRRRLERAGYVAVVVSGVPGWVPLAFAARIAQQVDFWREDVAKLLAMPPKPIGRPRKA